MKTVLFSFCMSLFTNLAFGQSKEKHFYNYLQNKIGDELRDGDSLIIDQYSHKDQQHSWQAVIKIKGDSCLVMFLPPAYSQDTMVWPGELIIINSFTVSKEQMLKDIEYAKGNLKNPANNVSGKVELWVTYRDNAKEFKLRRVMELYTRLRFNKPVAN